MTLLIIEARVTTLEDDIVLPLERMESNLSYYTTLPMVNDYLLFLLIWNIKERSRIWIRISSSSTFNMTRHFSAGEASSTLYLKPNTILQGRLVQFYTWNQTLYCRGSKFNFIPETKHYIAGAVSSILYLKPNTILQGRLVQLYTWNQTLYCRGG